MSGDASAETIRRVIATTWRGDNIPKTAADITRTWCLDLQWFQVNEAEVAVTALANAGWLIQADEGYVPTESGVGVTAPLGFWPRISHLQNPPSLAQGAVTSSTSVDPTVSLDDPNLEPVPPPSPTSRDAANESTGASRPSATAPIASSIDPRVKLVPRLIKYIARKAGIEPDEVERRMNRKQRSLGPITPWMCLILIAKEQGLPIEDIIVMFR